MVFQSEDNTFLEWRTRSSLLFSSCYVKTIRKRKGDAEPLSIIDIRIFIQYKSFNWFSNENISQHQVVFILILQCEYLEKVISTQWSFFVFHFFMIVDDMNTLQWWNALWIKRNFWQSRKIIEWHSMKIRSIIVRKSHREEF